MVFFWSIVIFIICCYVDENNCIPGRCSHASCCDRRQKFRSQVGTGCTGQGFIAEISGETRWKKKKERLPTALGLEGSSLSRQPLEILALNQPNLGNLIVQKGNHMLGEK